VTDNAGNVNVATIAIAVADTTPPAISISGAVFTPTVSTDTVRVEWYFDGGLSAITTTPPFTYALNLTPVSGTHTVFARAFDAAGNAADAASVNIDK
jgi:hypothetical protein